MAMTFTEASKQAAFPWQEESFFVSLPRCDGPDMREVILWNADAVWVMGDYNDDESLRASGCDDNGNCLLKVPASRIERVYSRQEAEAAELAYDADMRLLSYARG